MRWPPKPGTKILRWYLRTVAECGHIRGLPASQMPHEKLLDTVHGTDCFLRKIDFIAQHQNCLTRHVFVFESIKPSTVKFSRKCGRKHTSTKDECSTCQMTYVWYIKDSWGQRTWVAVRRHLLLYGESSVSSYCRLSQEFRCPDLKPSVLTNKRLVVHTHILVSPCPHQLLSSAPAVWCRFNTAILRVIWHYLICILTSMLAVCY